ncbi:hypothetical protein C4573_01930 [Candidatus Woesearchaeota archaeon]|nr:MAG: hypothetical protein C4573_01930 [Candidatus Woesearchaeota archaeon]
MLEKLLHSKTVRGIATGLALLTTAQTTLAQTPVLPFENPIKPVSSATVEKAIRLLIDNGALIQGVYEAKIDYGNNFAYIHYWPSFPKLLASDPDLDGFFITYHTPEGFVAVLDGGPNGPVDGIPEAYVVTKTDAVTPDDLLREIENNPEAIDLTTDPEMARTRQDVTSEIQHILTLFANSEMQPDGKAVTLKDSKFDVDLHNQQKIPFPVISPYSVSEVLEMVKMHPLNQGYQLDTFMQGGRLVMTYTDGTLETDWYGGDILRVRETKIDGKPEIASFTDQTINPEMKYIELLLNLAPTEKLYSDEIIQFIEFILKNHKVKEYGQKVINNQDTLVYQEYQLITQMHAEEDTLTLAIGYTRYEDFYDNFGMLVFNYRVKPDTIMKSVHEGFPLGPIDGIPEGIMLMDKDKTKVPITPEGIYEYQDIVQGIIRSASSGKVIK